MRLCCLNMCCCTSNMSIKQKMYASSICMYKVKWVWVCLSGKGLSINFLFNIISTEKKHFFFFGNSFLKTFSPQVSEFSSLVTKMQSMKNFFYLFLYSSVLLYAGILPLQCIYQSVIKLRCSQKPDFWKIYLQMENTNKKSLSPIKWKNENEKHWKYNLILGF